MELLPPKTVAMLPTLNETAELGIADSTVYAKIFNPMGAQTWYITAYDKDDDLAFGFVTLGDAEMAELGYIAMEDLRTLRLPFGLTLEMDKHFKPMPLKTVIDTVKSGHHI